MTREEFDALIQQIESYKAKTEPLTAAEVEFVDTFSKLYNTFLIAKASPSGISASSYATLIEQATKLQEQYNTIKGGVALFAFEPPVTTAEPTAPAVTDIKLDPTNPTKFVNELVAAGVSVDSGTKVEDVSKLQGVYNEYSSSVRLVESVKQQVAQQDGTPAITNEGVTVVPEGISVDTIEGLKNQVSQLLQEGEIPIVPEVVLNKNQLPLYKANIEGQLEIFNIKQDNFSPDTTIFRTAVDPYDTDTLAQLVAQGGVQLLEAAELAIRLEKEATAALLEQQAAAVESFTGGG